MTQLLDDNDDDYEDDADDDDVRQRSDNRSPLLWPDTVDWAGPVPNDEDGHDDENDDDDTKSSDEGAYLLACTSHYDPDAPGSHVYHDEDYEYL